MDDTAAPPTTAQLIDIWQQALTSVADVCEPLSDEQWHAPTDCPGWSVADVVAHLVDVEGKCLDRPLPAHEPRWEDLPHVTSDFGRFTELGVDARRTASKADVLAELRAVIAERRTELDAVPQGGEVRGPRGSLSPIDRVLRMRIFDTWVHEQDIRAAIGSDGGWNSLAAGVTFVQLVSGLPTVWSKNVQAPAGSVLRIAIIGPGLHREVFVTVDDEGKGVRCDAVPDPTVSLDTTWAAFTRLAAGRVGPGSPYLADKIEISGDPGLSDRLLHNFAVTP